LAKNLRTCGGFGKALPKPPHVREFAAEAIYLHVILSILASPLLTRSRRVALLSLSCILLLFLAGVFPGQIATFAKPIR